MPTNKPTYKWKFLRQPEGSDNILSDNGEMEWKVGEWQSVTGRIKLCENGLHCSDEILQALGYVKGEIIARVEVRGDHKVENDKSAWREMRLVDAYKWTAMDSVALAIYAAEQVITIYEDKYPNDSRPRDAIKAAKAYLKDPSKKNADAAYAAADAAYAVDAADAAAYAAAYAARAAYAADAADAAAYAARAAYAADAETTAKLNRWMNSRIKKLEKIS